MFPKGIDFDKIPAIGKLGMMAGDITGSRPIAWRASVKWGNSGNTPTKDFVATTNCLISMKGPLDDPYTVTASDMEKGLIFSTGQMRFVFGPKQEADAGICAIDPVSIMLNALFGMSFYVFGDAKYRDVLKPDEIHVTEFCYVMLITGNPETGWKDVPGVDPLHSTTFLCAKHNCADEECKRENP